MRKLLDVKERRGGGDKSSLLATYSIEGWLLMGDICMWKEHALERHSGPEVLLELLVKYTI